MVWLIERPDATVYVTYIAAGANGAGQGGENHMLTNKNAVRFEHITNDIRQKQIESGNGIFI